MAAKYRPLPRHLQRRAELEGYRSGLEVEVGKDLESRGVPVEYEPYSIEYEQPPKKRRYTPDFVLPNGIIIETKGRFVTSDRQKHLYIKASRPDLDIRFVFTNPHARISKVSKTTYAAWCDKHGFKWAEKRVPDAWLLESSDNRPAKAAAVRQRKCKE